jgi:hypothetical protein
LNVKNDPVRGLLVEFYSTPGSKLPVAKAGRNRIWDYFKKNRTLLKTEPGAKIVPSIASEIDDAIKANGALQRSVFSECVYTFELANKLGLRTYLKYSDQVSLPLAARKVLNSLELSPRYVYFNAQNTRFLVQAGGPNSYDAVLIDLDSNTNVKIEYKEPASKAKELDLNYDESGYLVKTEKFTIQFRQLLPMLNEAIRAKVNIFKLADSSTKNFISFSTPSILKALDDNYTGENTADVICTEDKNGYLVMMSSNDVTKFVDPPTLKGIAGIKGEIRSAGRNKYKVWSHEKLQEHIAKVGGTVNSGNKVTIETASMKATKGAGTSTTNRLKISSIFFVYVEDVVSSGGYTTFDLNAVRQIKATISAHMYFRKLKVEIVRDYYLT